MGSFRFLVVSGFAVGASMLVPTRSAEACRCMAPKPANVRMNDFGAVFLGTVTAVQPDAGKLAQSKTYTFKVNCSWKGDVGRTVRVSARTSGASCGTSFEKGATYLVFASKDDSGKFSTSSCAWNKKLAGAAEDIKLLTETTKPKCYDRCPPGLTNTIRCIKAPCPILCSVPTESSTQKPAER